MHAASGSRGTGFAGPLAAPPLQGGDAEGGAGGQANVSAQMLRAQAMA
jgi:hypothetical protein